MSLQDSNRYGDPICLECVLFYDCLHDDKRDCEDWQEENDRESQKEEEDEEN